MRPRFRHYDPQLREWTTLDPMMQDSHPYRCCFDNPMQYLDTDGQFVIAIPLIWTGGAALGKILVDSAIIASAAWLSHKAIKKGNEWADIREMQKKKLG